MIIDLTYDLEMRVTIIILQFDLAKTLRRFSKLFSNNSISAQSSNNIRETYENTTYTAHSSCIDLSLPTMKDFLLIQSDSIRFPFHLFEQRYFSSIDLIQLLEKSFSIVRLYRIDLRTSSPKFPEQKSEGVDLP